MKIYFLNGLRSGERIELSGKKIRIGRETDNDIIIETAGVSRYHAELIGQAGGDWLLKDLGSTNGSKVNTKLIKDEKLLTEGDVVALGDQNFRMGEKKTKAESKAKPPGIPIIQAVIKTMEDEKTATPAPVQKIVFEPIQVKTQKASKTVKKSSSPDPVIETVKSETAKAEPLMTAKELAESAANIFGAQSETSKVDKKTSAPVVGKHVFNILFYLILLMTVVIFVFWFLNSNKNTKKVLVVSVAREKEVPLVLYYVKDKITNNNVFRFSLLVENNTARFTIDDLKSDRHYNKTIKNIRPECLRALKTAIEDTGFMDLLPVSRGSMVDNLDETRQMTIALKNKFNSISIQNNSAPTSFEEIESAIEDFADAYDLLTFAMTPEELKKRAIASFTKAEEYYANRTAMPGNLLEAERRYKMTIDYLDQFSPKPRIWEIARKRHAEVEAMRKKRWKELRYEVERLERLAKIKDAIATLNEMIQLTSVDSKAYKKIQARITRLSERLNERKK